MEFNHPVGDYHVHPDYSFDATGSMREYCEKAIELGLSEIVFVPHAEDHPQNGESNILKVDGHRRPIDSEGLRRYRDELYDLVEGDDPVPIMVRCGVELGFYPGVKDSFLHMIEDMHFEYVLCGIHYVDGCIISSEKKMKELLSKNSPEQFIEKYYKIIQKACQIEFLDCLAHIDVYRRLGMKMFPEQASRIDYEVIDETMEHLVKYGLPVEVNTSGMRHGIGDWYPSKPLLTRMRQAGVLIGGLGSDSHHPDHLATDFEMAHLLVHETFPEIYED